MCYSAYWTALFGEVRDDDDALSAISGMLGLSVAGRAPPASSAKNTCAELVELFVDEESNRILSARDMYGNSI